LEEGQADVCAFPSDLSPMKPVISGIRMGHFGPQGGAETTFY
jgi:hypothetical protein